MKSMESWLSEYAVSHTNIINEAIHLICVPLIMFSIYGLVYSLSLWFALAFVTITLIFYIRLSIKISIYMLVVSCIMLFLLSIIPHLLITSLIIFAVSWVFQFIGHHIEGKKPSFFKDIQFLLIGPVWVLTSILTKFRLNTKS